eukprot:1613566-Alexandrium_andersonii.AAC.1
MKEAAADTIIDRLPRARKPWITDATLALIEQRSELASAGRYRDAELKDKEVKKQARADRTQWFQEKLTGKVWDPVRLLSKDRPQRV